MRSRTTNNNPWGIVLVPAEGDPGRLTQPGALGCMPPVARRWPARDPGTWEHTPPSAEVVLNRAAWRSQEVGLAVWWDGALVPEGWDRLLRCIDTDDSDHAPRHPPVGEVVDMANYALRYKVNLASRVVLLDLVDGRLVERKLSGPEPQQR